jgi:hypothetical protein
VWLVGECAGVVSLNGELLGEAAGPFAFDVTANLLARNEVALEGAGDVGEVALEVRGG